MTLIDSVDSILMLYSYSGFPENSWAVFQRVSAVDTVPTNAAGISADRLIENGITPHSPLAQTVIPPVPLADNLQSFEPRRPGTQESAGLDVENVERRTLKLTDGLEASVIDERMARDLRVKKNTMSGLSVILTLMSILVAFRSVSKYAVLK